MVLQCDVDLKCGIPLRSFLMHLTKQNYQVTSVPQIFWDNCTDDPEYCVEMRFDLISKL